MKFDFTNGKRPMYMVTIYSENCEDRMYYHYYKEATEKYTEILNTRQLDTGTIVSIYDLKNDVRKKFTRI